MQDSCNMELVEGVKFCLYEDNLSILIRFCPVSLVTDRYLLVMFPFEY